MLCSLLSWYCKPLSSHFWWHNTYFQVLQIWNYGHKCPKLRKSRFFFMCFSTTTEAEWSSQLFPFQVSSVTFHYYSDGHVAGLQRTAKSSHRHSRDENLVMSSPSWCFRTDDMSCTSWTEGTSPILDHGRVVKASPSHCTRFRSTTWGLSFLLTLSSVWKLWMVLTQTGVNVSPLRK